MAVTALPPGPKGDPLIGNLNLREFQRDPLGFTTRMAREYGDIVRLRWAHITAYLLSHPDYIEYLLLTHHRNFIKGRAFTANRMLLGNGLLSSDGEYWLRQRRLAQPAFHRDRVAEYAQIMVEYTDRMLACWKAGETRDVYEDMMALTLENAAQTLFGVDMAAETRDIGTVLHLVMERNAGLRSVLRLPGIFPTAGDRRLRQAIRRLDEIVYGIIHERRQSARTSGDLLSMLLSAQDEDGSGMTDEQLRDEAVTIIMAGHETTAIALSWTWYLLSQHPDVEVRLVEELQGVLGRRAPTAADLPRLAYAESIFLEAMRLYPPLWGLTRIAVRDCEIGGYLVKAGSRLAVSQWVMHRDPRYFDAPDAFRPERWADGLEKRLPRFVYFPFGGGPRLCVGKAFAMMEGVLLLARIAQQFRLTLAPGHTVTPWPSLTLRPKGGLPMRLARR